MRKGHADGKKFGHHTTHIPAAEPIIKYAAREPKISKIHLNRIVAGIHGRHRIKITRILAGLKVFVRGGSSGQELHIYTNDPETVEQNLERVFGEAFGA